MLASTTQFIFQSIVVGSAGLLLLLTAGVLVYSLIMTFRRAAVLPLAVRYASSRWINIVSICGIALGVAAVIVVLAVMNGFISTQRRTIRGALADLTIQPRATHDSKGNSSMPGAFAEYEKALKDCPHVVAIAPRFIWFGLVFPKGVLDIYNLSRGGADFVAELHGIDPDREFTVSRLEEWLRPPTEQDTTVTPEERAIFAAPDDPAKPLNKLKIRNPDAPPGKPLLIGVSKAYRLRMRRSDTIEVVTFPAISSIKNSKPANMFFDVVGMFKTGDYEYDSKTTLVPIAALQSLLSTDNDFTEIAVKLDDYERNAAAARDEIGKRLLAEKLITGRDINGNATLKAEIATWEEQKHLILGAIDNERSLLGFILFFIVIVATFIQFATLSMMVTEKTRDIGILSTLGASGGEILAVFVDVGLAMTIAGELLGLALGLFVAREETLNWIDRTLNEKFGVHLFDPQIYLLKSLPSEVQPAQVAVICAATLIAGVLFAIIPAVRASRLDPARALRFE